MIRGFLAGKSFGKGFKGFAGKGEKVLGTREDVSTVAKLDKNGQSA